MKIAWTWALALLVGVGTAGAADDLASRFTHPPASARPWVYWFPLSGNLTKEGITADLEAMARVGIGGVLYMEVDQGAPKGPADFAGPPWRELFAHACREAQRLGLEINMNNDAGWCGSGGPWITPELSMQRVVWTETPFRGPKSFAGVLPQPAAVRDFYRDIAVLAVPAPAGKAHIENFRGKSSFQPQHFPPQKAAFAALPADAVIRRDKIIDITARMDAHGRLAWDVPPGEWIIFRFGHTSTGKDNHPAPESGRGLECDKLSKVAAERHFDGLMGRLIADNRALAGAGKPLVSTHIDSWEVGSQNWTPLMREEFRRRRGYDLLPLLPTFTGRVVDSLEVSERFLWDVRQTVSDMLIENYAGHFRKLANRQGLRLSIEAYDGVPCDEMTYAGQADEPMAEFWSWAKFGAAYSCTEMASAAHTYGKRILGAEAFTAMNTEKWQSHPANIKDLGDWAFCEGINRFVFHRYAMQPWVHPNREPGMSMGPWGLHYERTQTWWEMSRAWHEYLARCQYLLQQGLFVADVCYLQPEGAPRRFVPPPSALVAPYVRGGYNFDGCTPEVVLTRMSVRDGRIVLPDGMSYRVLVLPEVETMTPALLQKIHDLVAAGATVFAPTRPNKAPGLTDYPQCDAAVKKLAGEVWGSGLPPGKLTERPLGRGRVIWGGPLTPKAAADEELPRLNLARWIWRKEGNPAAAAPPGTRYFYRTVTLEPGNPVASAQLAMAADNSFECWVNGRLVGSGDSFNQAAVLDVAAALRPGANLIAVAATNGGEAPNPAGLIGTLAVKFRDGRTLQVPTDRSWQAAQKVGGGWNTAAATAAEWSAAMELGPLGMRPWGDVQLTVGSMCGYPDAAIVHRWLAQAGLPPDFSADHTLRYIHRRIGTAEVYFVANGAAESFQTTCEFRVTGKRPELWHPETGRITPLPAYEIREGRTHVPLEFGPMESVFVVFRQPDDPAAHVVSITYDGQELMHSSTVVEPSTVVELSTAVEPPAVDVVHGQLNRPGTYVFQTATGGRRQINCDTLPKPLAIGGPWDVAFEPKWGGPAKVRFEKLDDWSRRPEEGIKYYSGAATYRTAFAVQNEILQRPGGRWYLDLGRVAVMAQLRVNGKDMGILWKPPYRADVTEALRPGDNAVEIKVVNLWINRQIGDQQLPEDSERLPAGTLNQWPQWLLDGKPSPAGRYTFTSWRLWKKGDPLQESGLLGPVELRQVQRLRMPLVTANMVDIEEDVAYLGPGRSEKGDLYRPAAAAPGQRFPAVLIIHGGGWSGGDKGAAREINIGTNLALNGYVGFSINYILAGKDHPTWPQNLYDCKTAVRWLRKNAQRLNIDPQHIGVIGGSAGGHLSAMVGLTGPEAGLDPPGPYAEFSCRVQAAVDLYGPTDLTSWPAASGPSMLPGTRAEKPALYRQASATTYAAKRNPPLLILHGTADTTVPVAQSQLLADALKKAGAEHELIIVEGAPHSFHLQPKQRDLRPVVLGFFDRCLKGPKPPASSGTEPR